MIKVVNTLPENKWRQFADNQPTGNIFHTPEMFRVFAQTKNHQPNLWAAVDDNDYPLVLFIPVTITLFSRLPNQLSSRTLAHGGVLCKPNREGQQALELLLQTYVQETKGCALFTELRNVSDINYLQSTLNKNGFIYEEHLNFLINLNQPTSQVLQNIGSRTRKKIRKGLRNKAVHVTEVTNLTELNHWYQVLQKTYSHKRVPIADYSLFESTFNQLYPKKMAKFLIAMVNGMPAACSLELLYKNTIYGWYGGSDRGYSNHYPNEMLMWHILEWGAEHNYQIYDFGGAGKPDEEYGVRDFKAKFGGRLVNFGRNTCIHHPTLLKFSKMGYEIYRRLPQRFQEK